MLSEAPLCFDFISVKVKNFPEKLKLAVLL